MADNDVYTNLRRMTGEVDSDTYTNVDLEMFLERAAGDLNIAAALIWGEKASAYADLVDISEAGSSRKNSDLFKHSKEQQTYFEGLSGSGTAGASGTRVGRIVRW